MKKKLLILALATVLISCKPSDDRPEKDWIVEVHYLDNTIDTLTIRSQGEPEINVRNGVSIINCDWGAPQASYVKTIKILN